jgi:disulfide bond formation protein DsbB
VSANDDTMILFFSLLTVFCHVFLASALIIGLAGGISPAMRTRRRAIQRALGPVAAPFAFCVAAVTMGGSLYLSEVKHFVPCHLCWIQRTLLYPQVLWTVLLSLRPHLRIVRRFAIATLIIDIPVSTYHVLLQHYPNLETSTCSFSNPCTQRYIDTFHYLSEPLMALTAALTILTLLLIQKSIAALEFAIWVVTAAVTLCILLFVGSDAWQIALLPIVVFVVIAVREQLQARKVQES